MPGLFKHGTLGRRDVRRLHAGFCWKSVQSCGASANWFRHLLSYVGCAGQRLGYTRIPTMWAAFIKEIGAGIDILRHIRFA